MGCWSITDVGSYAISVLAEIRLARTVEVMTHLFFSKAYDNLMEMERVWLEAEEKYGQPSLFFFSERTARTLAVIGKALNGDEGCEPDRDLVNDPHPSFPYVVEESVLTDAGFTVLHDADWRFGTRCRVPLEEPLTDTALRVISLCKKFNEPVDVSHYKLAHSVMFRPLNFNARDERLVNCLGFSPEWLAENRDSFRSESRVHKRSDDSEDPTTNQYSVDVVNGDVSLIYSRGENVLPKGMASSCFGRVMSTSIHADDLSSTAELRLISGEVIEGYARSMPPDAVGAAMVLSHTAVAASEAHVFRTESYIDIEPSVKQSGHCEVSITGLLADATYYANPWTGRPFWSLRVVIHKDRDPGFWNGNELTIDMNERYLMEQTINVFTPSLQRLGAMIPRGNDLCTVTGVLCLGEYTEYANEHLRK
jgi:hypothetical protein